MAEEQAVQKQRHRSPNYPAISLPQAVERITRLYKEDGRSGSLLESAVKHFGFNRAHGTAMALVSALRKYGLIDVSNNRVTLTARGLNIVLFPDADARKQTAIKEAALAPEIYADLYNRFLPSGKIVSEQTLTAELVAEMKFNPRAVSEFVRDFKETLIYAGLLAEDGVTLRSGGDSGPGVPARQALKAGDYVQWEPKGILQFQEPKCIRSLSDDGQFALGDWGDTGLPLSELTLQAKPETPVVIPNALSEKSKMREEIISLTEGPVKIQWPTPLSSESIEDIKIWLKFLERRIARSGVSAKEQVDESQ
jgi:hypothetical protein